MSRIGKLPIKLPKGVTVEISKENVVTVKGPKGELTQQIDSDIKIEKTESELTFVRPTESKRHKSLHGLSRALVNNMVVGVTEGYIVKQELVGVGYRVTATGQILEFHLGYSHPIYFKLPKEIKVAAEMVKGQNPLVTMECTDKQLIGQVAAKIRSLREPEPYKGKGIKFQGETLRRKAGKSNSKK